MIAQEYRVRCRRGDKPTVDEYRRRFPDYDVDRILSQSKTPDPERIDAFLHEARSAARLRHSRIVSVLDAGTLDDGRGYVVFEYVAGQTLRDRIRTGTYTRDQAVNWCIEIAKALHYAHTRQVVHRDQPPSPTSIPWE